MTPMDLFGLIVNTNGGFSHNVESLEPVPYHVGPFIGSVRRENGGGMPTIIALDVDGEETAIKVSFQMHHCDSLVCKGGIDTVVSWVKEPSDIAKTKLRLAL